VADHPPAGAAPAHTPEKPPETRDELLKLLDRETAIARATDGRVAVLVLDLRRVDRLHALLKGPSPAMTMTLVLERLRKALRPEDRVAPISDEQACVVLPRLAHQSQAVLAAVKLLRALDRPIAHEGGSAVLRPCVGIATLPEHGYDPAELLMAADISRQIAATREEGYHVFQGDEAVEAEVYRGLDLDLERAIRANELELHYLPQIELASARPVGVEALLRWKHVKAGDIPPQTMVGIAERTGLIGSLTFWVLNAALRQAAEWKAAGRTMRIAINLSTSTLTDRELPAVVDQSLKTWGVAAPDLTLEIAESAMISDAERSVAILTRLKAVGVRLAIDDFGTGFSSLSHMRRFPIDELKIDQSFVRDVMVDPNDATIAKAIIALALELNLKVTAEGVETEKHIAFLQEHRCDQAQGFYFSRPLPSHEFGALLGQNLLPATADGREP
jgi:diguanylate cyclase